MCCAGLSRSVSDSLQPCGLKPSRLLCPWGFSRQEYWSGLPCLPPGDLSNPGIEPRFPSFQANSVPSEPPIKSKNTGVGSLSLLQGIFLTQKSNRGLQHRRWIFLQAELPGKPFLLFICLLLQGHSARNIEEGKGKFCFPSVQLFR